MPYEEIEPKIKNLVETFNEVGFETHASCQGHRMCLGKASAPYIAFRTDNQQKLCAFAKLISDDQMLMQPNLFWVWKIEPCFNCDFKIDYRLTMSSAYRWRTRFSRNRIDKDFQTIGNLLKNLTMVDYKLFDEC